MATAVREAPREPEASFDGATEATKTTEELFQWSAYVHVGRDAEECEHREDGACADPHHFHAWLCQPNAFQARDIQDRARAAKARRRLSLLRDGSKDGEEPSDAYLVLEDQLDAWTLNEQTVVALKKTIADRTARAAGKEIVRSLDESDEFEDYAEHLAEFRRVAALPEGKRDPEEWDELQKSVEGYQEEFGKRMTERYETELRHLDSKDVDSLLDMERRYQRDEIANEHFMHTFNSWTYYTCARKPVTVGEGYPTERVFATVEDMRAAPPEVIAALHSTYRRLESRVLVRGDAAGN